MGAEGWIRASVHDEYGSHIALVWLWSGVVDLGEEVSGVDG